MNIPSRTLRDYTFGEFESDENKVFNIQIYTMTRLDPQWIVGFVDGEGCFNLDVHVKKDMKWGLQMQPEFTVVQHERDIQTLYSLKEHFKCGSVAVNRRDDTSTRYHFRVKSVRDGMASVIPFFEQHTLKTKRNVEFKRYRRITQLMSEQYHLKSLSNFLEVYDLGQALRVRSGPKRGKKDEKVKQVIDTLRKRLEEDPTLL